jgi:hypothetical protein
MQLLTNILCAVILIKHHAYFLRKSSFIVFKYYKTAPILHWFCPYDGSITWSPIVNAAILEKTILQSLVFCNPTQFNNQKTLKIPKNT